jgi:hypothetical protein
MRQNRSCRKLCANMVAVKVQSLERGHVSIDTDLTQMKDHPIFIENVGTRASPLWPA